MFDCAKCGIFSTEAAQYAALTADILYCCEGGYDLACSHHTFTVHSEYCFLWWAPTSCMLTHPVHKDWEVSQCIGQMSELPVDFMACFGVKDL